MRKLGVGGAYLRNERPNGRTSRAVLGAPGPAQWDLPGRFDMRGDGRFTSLYRPFGTFKDNDIGLNRIIGAFAMVDYALTKRLRAVGGLRGEQTNMITDIRRYYEQGLDPSDPARGTVGDVSAYGELTLTRSLRGARCARPMGFPPSINLIYKLKDDDQAPMNLRLNYFKSLARPSFREFSVVQLFDYILGAPVYGNPKLQMTTADNYDLRIERFFRSRNNVSVSAFHKEFKNHIELVFTASGGYTWRNAIRSSVTGVEVEGRVGILRWIEWRGNVTLMQSQSVLRTTLLAEPVEYTTNMFGQAPYMVNSMLTFSSDSARASLSGEQRKGRRWAISNSEVNPMCIRAYEMPRHGRYHAEQELRQALGPSPGRAQPAEFPLPPRIPVREGLCGGFRQLCLGHRVQLRPHLYHANNHARNVRAAPLLPVRNHAARATSLGRRAGGDLLCERCQRRNGHGRRWCTGRLGDLPDPSTHVRGCGLFPLFRCESRALLTSTAAFFNQGTDSRSWPPGITNTALGEGTVAST
ncbi:MAG: TonB-dependent receptor [Flavobacteriales bacterium]|nr:TonB-dependent receptor [Flavobacteriales bacterium]